MLKPRTNYIGNVLENRKTVSVIQIMPTIEICSISLKENKNNDTLQINWANIKMIWKRHGKCAIL